MIELYDYVWATQRRVCDVLSDDVLGVAAELSSIVSADPSLVGVDLPTPEAYFPCDNETEAAEVREALLAWGCVYATGGDTITPLTGDLQTRTDEHAWELTVAIAIVVDAGGQPLQESWDKLDHMSRERRRVAVVLGAIMQTLSRHGRNGVDIVQILPTGRPEFGKQQTDHNLVRWGRQAFSVISQTLIPQHGSLAP